MNQCRRNRNSAGSTGNCAFLKGRVCDWLRFNFQRPTPNAQLPGKKFRLWELGLGSWAVGVCAAGILHGSTATKPQTRVPTQPRTPVFPDRPLPDQAEEEPRMTRMGTDGFCGMFSSVPISVIRGQKSFRSECSGFLQRFQSLLSAAHPVRLDSSNG